MAFSIFQDVKKRKEEKVIKKHQYEIRVMQNWAGFGGDKCRTKKNRIVLLLCDRKGPLTLLMPLEVSGKALVFGWFLCP